MNVGIPIGGTMKSDEPLSIKTDERNKNVTIEPLLIESLNKVFPKMKFRCETDDSSYYSPKIYEGLVNDRESYFQALNKSKNVKFVIERNELANVIVSLSRELYTTMHSVNRIHGDVKPSNILFLAEGPKLIDSRGCKLGSISATYTPNWA